jgi:hypothetical protein
VGGAVCVCGGGAGGRRWGDGPVRTLALALLGRPGDAVRLQLPYWHQTFVSLPIAPPTRNQAAA